mmetsp:Transcript_9183/g.18396  ORF Transcript_9183/g.18396 Transcript_9183/m.18396 type:complete len:206 (+) Transcript_9183:2158-2775(+)
MDLKYVHVVGRSNMRGGQELRILEEEFLPERRAGRPALNLEHLKQIGGSAREGKRPRLERRDSVDRGPQELDVFGGGNGDELLQHEHERKGLDRDGLDGLGGHAQLMVEGGEDLENFGENLLGVDCGGARSVVLGDGEEILKEGEQEWELFVAVVQSVLLLGLADLPRGLGPEHAHSHGHGQVNESGAVHDHRDDGYLRGRPVLL